MKNNKIVWYFLICLNTFWWPEGCKSKIYTEETFFSDKKVNKKGITKEYAKAKKLPSIAMAEEYQSGNYTDPKKEAEKLNKEMEKRKLKSEREREKWNKKVQRKRHLKKAKKSKKKESKEEVAQ